MATTTSLQSCLLAATLGAFAASASAQGVDLEGRLLLTAYPGYSWSDRCMKFFDADGDGDLDLGWGGDDTDQSYLGIREQRGHGVFDFVHQSSWIEYVIPSAIAAGDIDGAGPYEIVYATALQRAVVLTRNAGGAWVQTSEFPIQSSYSDLEIGDLDGDGDADVAGVRDTSLRVHWNQGGLLGAPTVIALPASAGPLALGDVDGDGRLDAVVSSSLGGGSVAVVFGLGGGAFASPVSYAAGGTAQGLVLADFDGDGRLDVATANGTAATVSVLLNAGQGVLSAPVTSPAGIVGRTIGAGDADGDGDPDLVVAGGGVAVLANVGAGTFASPAVLSTLSTREAALTDLDGDGDLDVAIVDRDALRNRGDGTFVADVFELATVPISGFTTGDVDNDGDEDLVEFWYGSVRLRKNRGDGTLEAPAAISGASLISSVKLADIDADGDLDLVVNGGDPGIARVFVNQGGSFAAPVTIPGQAGSGPLEIADLDGDTRLDVVTKVWNGFAVASNTGGVTWAAFAPIAGVNATWGTWTVADVDGDGDPDLVTSQQTAVRVHANLGSLVFAPPVDVAPLWTLAPILAADLDLDGDVDLVAADASTTSVLWNQGSGAFAAPLTVAGSFGGLSAEDIDHDGDVDVLGTRPGSHVEVLENLGGSTFARAPAAGIAGSAAVGTIDIDGDGDEDLFGSSVSRPFVIENRARTGLALCAGDGSGTPCPCGNSSPPGAGLGCLNSTGRAGTLTAFGSSSLHTDTLKLRGTGMTNSFALYFQGTTTVANGAGAVFGDALRCVAGSVVRLGVRVNSAGSSLFPGTTDPALRVAGQVVAPGVRLYQVWFRDALPFCTSATWSLTNALRVVWSL